LKKVIILALVPLFIFGCSRRPKTVDYSEYVKINGAKQFIVAKGATWDNPVLLYLHGGPGQPETPLVLNFNDELQYDFSVVLWDQRGAGRSYFDDIPPESMTLEQLIADAHELTQRIKIKFNKKKILLVGHGWGTVLGMNLVHLYPDDYYAYVGVSQVCDATESEIRSYVWTLKQAQAAGSTEAISELNQIGLPEAGVYQGGVSAQLTQKKWLTIFGGGSAHTKHFRNKFQEIMDDYYTADQKEQYAKGFTFSMNLLGPTAATIDLFKIMEKVEVPIYFISGKYDYKVNWQLSKEFLDALKAPQKEFILYEDSADDPNFEQAEKFNRFINMKMQPLCTSGKEKKLD